MKNSIAGGIIISVALLAMPQSVVPVSAQPQAPSESSLTVQALNNATYHPLNPEIFGDTVQLVDGNYSGTLFDPIGGIHQDTYVFDDLNGDGADDAVAIVVELLGCCASSMNVILAVYVNDSGVPTFLDSVSLGGPSAVNSVTVESGIITVAGLQVGPRDAACCPTVPFVKQFTLEGARLVAASPTAAQPAAPASTGALAGGLPASTADLSAVNSGFAGQVLIPETTWIRASGA